MWSICSSELGKRLLGTSKWFRWTPWLHRKAKIWILWIREMIFFFFFYEDGEEEFLFLLSKKFVCFGWSIFDWKHALAFLWGFVPSHAIYWWCMCICFLYCSVVSVKNWVGKACQGLHHCAYHTNGWWVRSHVWCLNTRVAVHDNCYWFGGQYSLVVMDSGSK